ncbi:MAG: conserved phage C-terminal domain-containing protein, partial [Deltaproteobacteria bacterium]|nr:conserved phage C-terminal domain-containing protein [Deltaproteobacteria bacterium]
TKSKPIKSVGVKTPNSFLPVSEKTIRALNELAGTTYRHNTKATVRLIGARLAEGYTEEDLAVVLEHQWNEWGDNEKMAGYFRPETLFAAKHFEGYLQAAKLDGNGHAPVIEELEGGMVKVDGVTMDRQTCELRYGRAN